jgi:hypothetical protein
MLKSPGAVTLNDLWRVQKRYGLLTVRRTTRDGHAPALRLRRIVFQLSVIACYGVDFPHQCGRFAPLSHCYHVFVSVGIKAQ